MQTVNKAPLPLAMENGQADTAAMRAEESAYPTYYQQAGGQPLSHADCTLQPNANASGRLTQKHCVLRRDSGLSYLCGEAPSYGSSMGMLDLHVLPRSTWPGVLDSDTQRM